MHDTGFAGVSVYHLSEVVTEFQVCVSITDCPKHVLNNSIIVS